MTETELKLMAAAAIIGLRSTPEPGVEDAGRDRHARGVVDEREKQVLPDVRHRPLRQPARADDAGEVALHERDAGAFHRDVGAGAHRDADVGPRQRRGVVDAVAGHRDAPALALERRDVRGLLLRQHAGMDVVDRPSWRATAVAAAS